MEQCLHCGNCKLGVLMYYCTARNEFILVESTVVLEKKRTSDVWKEGDPAYEKRRRRIRKEKSDLQRIG